MLKRGRYTVTKKIDELIKLHTESKSLDREATAEMRSNILLVAGEHYSKKVSDLWSRARVGTQGQDNYKLRITKNWLHRAHRIYVNSIISQSPGIAITPRTQTELKDQKSAELNQAVWNYAKSKYRLKSLFRELCSDYCGIGEAAVKIFFDPNRGQVVAYNQKMDGENPVYDEQGNPAPDESSPVHSGEFVFERVFGQNIFRDPSCNQMKDAKWIGLEKLESTEKLKTLYKDDEKKKKMIYGSAEDFIVFDSSRGGYQKDKDQSLIMEVYYKPCHEYPEGYFYIFTKGGILEEGPLPNGIFPLVWAGFDEHPTKPRATSMVKVARPWQAEINRASSQVALHSVTIGEDKILYQSGTAVSQGQLLPGVRGITYQGAPPTVLPGRTGEQFFQYISMQEAEMNRALMIDGLDQEKTTNLDPYSMLFKSMSQSQKFNFYSEKFGEFIVQIGETFLELAKFYLEDGEIVGAIGSAEAINIQEFKATQPLNHLIKLEEQDDTIESKLGKTLVLNHVLQYVGKNLERDDIGKLVTQMPFGNWEEGFSDFTLDTKNAKNDFLAMERGELPNISKNDNSKYILKQVSKRKKERDFNALPPQVQNLYAQYENFHNSKIDEEIKALKSLEAELVPTGGGMIACDMYVPAEDPTKAPKRVRVPYQALDWLVNTLEQQGMTTDKLEAMNEAQMTEIAKRFNGGGNGVPPQQQIAGQESPNGVM